MHLNKRDLEKKMFKAVLALGLYGCGLAYAATGGSANTGVSNGIVFGLLLAYATRERPIGGWLFYFYMQVVGSVLLMALSVPMSLHNLQPSGWQDARLYLWFVLGTVPVLVLQIAEIVMAFWLLSRRNEQNVGRLRFVLAALACAGGVSLAIDLAFFPDIAVFDVLTLGFSAIWFAYFTRSVRVRRVFIAHDWPPYKTASRTREELQYLNRRALVFGAIAFVGVLVLEAFYWDRDVPPSAALLVGPVVGAGLAWLIGRFMELSTSKKAALNKSGPALEQSVQPPAA